MTTEAFRKGLEGVIAGESSISQVDPVSDRLVYRGYAIQDLTAQATYEEVVHLLLRGTLPTRAQLATLQEELARERAIPAPLLAMLRALPPTTHPMDALRTAVSWLGCQDPELTDRSRDATIRKAVRLIASVPTMIAAQSRLAHGQEPLPPRRELTHVQHVFYLLSGKVPDAFAARVLDVSFILYAEHGFNASTFSARVTASTISDLYAAITSALGTLKGTLHGGANEQVMRMLLAIGEASKAEAWITRALAEKQKIMGFGHRVYKQQDSRTPLLKALARQLSERDGHTAWFELAERVEAVVRREKGLLANVDFYAALTYYLLQLPIELYTPLFAAARMAGWCSHVIEQFDQNRLIRPECEYRGPVGVRFVPLAER